MGHFTGYVSQSTGELNITFDSVLIFFQLTGKFRTGQGKPGEVICKIAEEEGAQLIITGTRGLGKIRRTFLGSVSDFILHHAHVPVLVTRHK